MRTNSTMRCIRCVHLFIDRSRSECEKSKLFKCENDQLMCYIQFNVNVKTRAHVFRFLIQKIKIDVKQIIRRRYADVASKFLNNQKIVFFQMQIDQKKISVSFFSLRTLYCNIKNVDCVVMIFRFASFLSSFCC